MAALLSAALILCWSDAMGLALVLAGACRGWPRGNTAVLAPRADRCRRPGRRSPMARSARKISLRFWPRRK